ncbi:MAG: methylated-DNA--[protein]-cysteine S-methyltransferase [Streptosporangiaceae bacterium]
MISSGTAATTRAHIVLASPIGPLTLVAEHGQLTGLYMDTQAHRPDSGVLGGSGDPRDEPFASAARQLEEYFAGQRTAFDLPLAPAGTQFQRRVWAALQAIPYGQTWSYRKLANAVGNASASRAVGLANGRNPIAVVIPCHRVIGSDGSLTGYGGGLDRKRYLLGLEAGAEREPAAIW